MRRNINTPDGWTEQKTKYADETRITEDDGNRIICIDRCINEHDYQVTFGYEDADPKIITQNVTLQKALNSLSVVLSTPEKYIE